MAAGRGRVIWQLYENAGGVWKARGEAKLDAWEALLADLPAGCLVSGEIDEDGLRQMRAAKAAGHALTIALAADRMRRAGYLADLALERLREHGAAAYPAGRVVPIYMKAPG